jgi:hypothetical protein
MLFAEPMTENAEKAFAEFFTCTFEEYDKEINGMRACGKPAYGYVSRPTKALCLEHFEYARGAAKNVEKSKYVTPATGWKKGRSG